MSDPNRCLVVDPGLDFPLVSETMLNLGVEPAAILCTHGHFDHIGGAVALQEEHGAPIYLHAADVKLARTANFTMMICNVPGRIRVPDVTVGLEEGVLHLSPRDNVRVLHTPGHTPGSCLFKVGNNLFTGDTILRRGVSKNRLPGEDLRSLANSVNRVREGIPLETMIYPGHGGQATFAEILRDNSDFGSLLEGR